MTVAVFEAYPLGEMLRAVVLSIRPRYAHALLDGRKTVELRRTRLNAPLGTLLILYASAPVMSVVGTATLAHRDTDIPDRLWQRHCTELALTREEFDSYLVGTDIATALTVRAVHRLTTPVTLRMLRNDGPFQPPQSYRYLSADDPQPLHELAGRMAPCRQHTLGEGM